MQTSERDRFLTWKLCSKQNPSSSVARRVRAELVSQQSNRADGQSLSDAHGGGESNHTGSHHHNPDSSHHHQLCASNWKTEQFTKCSLLNLNFISKRKNIKVLIV